MNIEEKITIELKPSDLKEIIKEYFKYKYDVLDVSFKIASKYIGCSMNEHTIDYFECAKIDAKIKNNIGG